MDKSHYILSILSFYPSFKQTDVFSTRLKSSCVVQEWTPSLSRYFSLFPSSLYHYFFSGGEEGGGGSKNFPPATGFGWGKLLVDSTPTPGKPPFVFFSNVDGQKWGVCSKIPLWTTTIQGKYCCFFLIDFCPKIKFKKCSYIGAFFENFRNLQIEEIFWKFWKCSQIGAFSKILTYF